MSGKITNRKVMAGLVLAGAAIAIATPLAAHHSTAMFEWGSEKTMKNVTIEKWEWTNPHTFLFVKVKEKDGKEHRWSLEGMSPNHLQRYGWSRKSFAVGDKVDLTYYPLRDKRRGGFNVTVEKADGKKLFQFGERGTTQ